MQTTRTPGIELRYVSHGTVSGKYMKSSINPAERDKIESAWLLRWKERLGNPSRLLQKVMRMYLEDMDITSDDLDAQMDWEC